MLYNLFSKEEKNGGRRLAFVTVFRVWHIHLLTVKQSFLMPSGKFPGFIAMAIIYKGIRLARRRK